MNFYQIKLTEKRNEALKAVLPNYWNRPSSQFHHRSGSARHFTSFPFRCPDAYHWYDVLYIGS